ncbi:MAG: hypothetical protein IPM80_00030 [Proteobacteria bacterium]|nr:hypothetical protein [Pseudomonadota bacterium]
MSASTLGTDLAPPGRRSEFLGLWRLLTDAGTSAAGGPMVISALLAVVRLGSAALGVAAAARRAGQFVVYRFVEETRTFDRLLCGSTSSPTPHANHQPSIPGQCQTEV